MTVKTKIKRILAILSITAITANSAFAATQIGTGSVTWSGAFNSAIMWNDTIPGSASGTVNWIIVTAKVLPTLSMVVSTGAINLGTLTSAAYATWSLDIEVWTNASNWVTVTAKSWTGWLRSTSVAGSIINSLSADGITESYKFTSALSWASDSSVAWYTRSWALSTEITDNTTSYTLYSTNKPEASSWSSDVTFYVSAKVDDQTPAALNYTDTVSLTVTWNF